MLRPQWLVLGLLACACGGTSNEENATSEQGVHSVAAAETTCDLGWGDSPTSFDGIAGTFGRAGVTPPNGLSVMSLGPIQKAPDHISAEADATRTLECGSTSCAAENARASLLPVNHAMNPMIMFSTNGFTRPNLAVTAAYNVLGIKRSTSGEIASICLYDLAMTDRPFLMVRR